MTMRIVIDLQACQSASAQRGIGRHSFEMARAIAVAQGSNEVWLALNAAFPASTAKLRRVFSDLVGKERIAVFTTPTPAASLDTTNAWRSRVGEPIRETFLHGLRPDIVHVASLFEGLVDDAVASVGTIRSSHATATTLYDLIPMASGEGLPTAASVDWYHRKIASLKRSDLLLALSDHARAQAVAQLPMQADRVVVVSTAASEVFRPGALPPDAVSALCARHGITRPFVLHAGGFDARKNVANLIAAYARLPLAVRSGYQLVLVGAIDRDARGRLRALYEREGLNHADVLFPGWLPDADLAALYGNCELSCLPSFQEGFGLPALEAMACGAAVVGANATSVPEVIGRSDALFDPANVDAVAAKIHAVLTDRAFRADLQAHGLRQSARFTWRATARRALDAMEECVSRRRREAENRRAVPDGPSTLRPTLVYVSPLPPERTGIAAYSRELLPHLARYYDIELVASQASVELPGDMGAWPVRSVEWLEANADRCPRVLYQIGNSPAHQWMFDLLERLSGTVVLHDFFLGGVLNWMDESWLAPGTFRDRLFESHGYSALIADSALGRAAAIDRYPCNSRVVEHANGIIVHSDEALRMATTWLGDTYDQWRWIPQPRRLGPVTDREPARRALQMDDSDFVVCCFGFIDPAKLDHRLLSSWLGSALAREPGHRLVFVGQNHGGEYGQSMLRSLAGGPAGGSILITGFVDDDTYRRYLCAADAAVQLRGVSRGESARTALDCLAHGLPLIANASDSLSALPDNALIRLRADFDDSELSLAIERLAVDKDLRARLSRAGRAYVGEHHDPARVALQLRDEIERFAADGRRRRYDVLIGQVVAQTAAPAPLREDWVATAASIAFDLPATRLPQLLVDVTVLARQDLKTGIERVVRAVLRRLLEHPPDGFRIEPVVARADCYVYARAFTCGWLGLADALPDEVAIDVGRGDVFMGLDWAADVVPRTRQMLACYRAMGLEITFVVYDLLPLQNPDFYPVEIEDMQRTWLTSIAAVADGLVCISRSVESELLDWLDRHGPARDSPLNVGAFRLGADIDGSVPTSGDSNEGAELIARMGVVPSAVMVGTVEPRKGHRQVVAAFEQLWRDGIGLDLVIVGKKGWMVDDFASMLHTHSEAGRRLHWIQDASDAMVDRVYARACVLVAASLGEGFGLPLVEAARHGLPIVARDLPVFREVAGEHAYYFSGRSADDLAGALKAWLELRREARHPRSEGLPHLTWAESTDELLDVVLGGRWNATWKAPRQDTPIRSLGDDPATEVTRDAGRRSAAASDAAQPDGGPQTAFSHERA